MEEGGANDNVEVAEGQPCDEFDEVVPHEDSDAQVHPGEPPTCIVTWLLFMSMPKRNTMSWKGL